MPTKRGARWTAATVEGLLLSPTYLGLIPVYDSRAGGKHVGRRAGYQRMTTLPGQHPALIDQKNWERARDLAMPAKPRQVAPWSDRPLSGLVRCGECGRRCYVVGYKPYLRYRCRPYGAEACPSRRTVGVTALEAAVRGWALSVARDGRAVREAALEMQREELERARTAAATRGPLEAQLREIESRQERLLQALYVGQAPALIVERLRQEEAALEAAKAKLAAAGHAVDPVPLAQVLAWIREALASGASDLRQLRPLIEKIELRADPEALPVLRALGSKWRLPIPVQKSGAIRRQEED